MSIIFVDFEGSPIIEAAAIAVDSTTIIDVFHGYASAHQHHSFPEYAIHGLCPLYLRENGHRRPEELLLELKNWLRRWPTARLVANGPGLEASILGRRVDDAGLPPWVKRAELQCHKMAKHAKQTLFKINGVSCTGLQGAHRRFRGWPKQRTPTDLVKADGGHHCALYDCFELFLFMKYDCWGDLMLDC